MMIIFLTHLRSILKTMLQYAIKDNCFTFDDNIYIQQDGVAMGSPLGPVLANIFMCEIEEKYAMLMTLLLFFKTLDHLKLS